MSTETKFRVTDDNAMEPASTRDEVVTFVSNWYDYEEDDSLPEFDEIWDQYTTTEDDGTETWLAKINEAIRSWENARAEAAGAESFSGHGNYYVSAGSSVGYSLRVDVDDNGSD